MSVYLSRDERDFDVNNFNLINNYYDYKKNEFKKNRNLDIYFKNFKEYNYTKKTSSLRFLIDFTKFIKQLIDIIFIIIIIFSLRILILLGLKKNNKINFSEEKIYSIYYSQIKKNKSSEYYYPNLSNHKNIFFISSFSSSKFICLGILSALIRSNYISPANVLGIKKLLLTTAQFLHLYFYELYLALMHKNFSLLRFWYSWTKASEIYYSFLVYNSIILISRKSKNCEFIAWYENQITSKAFSLGVSFSIKSEKLNSKLSTFNGTPFSLQYKQQYLPSKLEVDIGFWGTTYYLQDENSMEEMKIYLTKKKIDILLKSVPKDLSRISNKSLSLKKKNVEDRIITIFTHDSSWDLLACLLAIINLNCSKNSLISEQINASKIVYVRLHPFLKVEKVIKDIQVMGILPAGMKIIFIDNKMEDIQSTILFSKYCVFGVSSYLNVALKLGSIVLAVDTNHINKPPIQFENLASPNLEIISPF